jgi:hypothetical protein
MEREENKIMASEVDWVEMVIDAYQNGYKSRAYIHIDADSESQAENHDLSLSWAIPSRSVRKL